MERYDSNVATIMKFLKENSYSASVISFHRICYCELKEYLIKENICYSLDNAYHWAELNKKFWQKRKYTGRIHCIKQLDDVANTGHISLDNLSSRKPPYICLNKAFKAEVDSFIADNTDAGNRHRIAISRFLLYLQNNGVENISELNYAILLKFHKDDYHTSSKTKDRYDSLIRMFLRYLALNGKCPFGLSLALNKLLVHQIIELTDDEIYKYSVDNQIYPVVTWEKVLTFLEGMANENYSDTVLKTSKHTLTLLYIFLDMHNVKQLTKNLLWYWFDKLKPVLGIGWKQHRRSICQFVDYLINATITTTITGNPTAIKKIDTLPSWLSLPLKDYLALLKREGMRASTINMYSSSNLRFCKYMRSIGIEKFSDITAETIKEFNLQDKHSTPEGKAAYNCRIRNFLIYLYEEKYLSEPYLYNALPIFSASRFPLVETLSKEDVTSIWSVNPDKLSPCELRDYAMVCIGLTMGFRASDIVALRFENINWREKSISIVQRKTGKALIMPMPIKTGNILFKYIRFARPRSNAPYVFIRSKAPYYNLQPSACRKALKRFVNSSSKSCKFHSVRKTFATQLLESNNKVELISDSLGHSTDETVHEYLSLNEYGMRMCALAMSDADISYTGGAFDA